MSIPYTTISLLDFCMEANNTSAKSTIITPGYYHTQYFGLEPELLRFNIFNLVKKTFHRRSNLIIDNVKVSISRAFSPLCINVFETYLTRLIMSSIFYDNHTHRWLPSTIHSQDLSNWVNDTNPEHPLITEKDYIEYIFNQTKNGNKHFTRDSIFNNIISYITNSFIIQWQTAGLYCGIQNPTMRSTVTDLTLIFDKMLLHNQVPQQCIPLLTEHFQIAIDNWERKYISKQITSLELQISTQNACINKSIIKNNLEHDHLNELREEITRMQHHLKAWEATHADNISIVNKKIEVLSTIEHEKSLYLLANVSRDLRQLIIRETTQLGGFHTGTLVDVVQIITQLKSK